MIRVRHSSREVCIPFEVFKALPFDRACLMAKVAR